MAFSFIDYQGDGSTTLWGVTFDFISRDHVDVIDVSDGSPVSFSWITDSQIEIDPALPSSTTFRIRRATPVDSRVVDFQDATVLDEADLDKSANQNFYVAQELLDTVDSKMEQDLDSQWDARGEVIKNLADPSEPQDAVTKSWAETSMTSNLSQAIDAKDDAESARSLSEDARDASQLAKTQAETARDAAQTAQGLSEDARDASQLAKTQAEAARDASQTAQGLSEDARDASQTAQGLSEDARDASQTAQGLSEDAQSAAELAQSAAELARQGAELAEGNADTFRQVAGVNAAVAEDARDEAEAIAESLPRVYDTVADMVADTSLTPGEHALTYGYNSAGDGGGNAFIIESGNTTEDGGSKFNVGTNSAIATFPGGVVSVKQFGAVSDWDGSSGTDNTDAFNNAMFFSRNVFIPRGDYYLTDEVSVYAESTVRGDGRRDTIIHVDDSFNLSADGVFKFTGGEPGPELSDLTIQFHDQPDSATLGDYIQYPAAVHAVGQPRFKLNTLRIEQAWVGVNMEGNSGGSIIDDLELSMFAAGVLIDGSVDSVKLSKLHIWPFGFSGVTNKRAIYSNSRGLDVGRCDDFQLTQSLIFSITEGARFADKGSGTVFGNIIGTDFDDRGGLHMVSNGELYVSGCFFSLGETDSRLVTQTDGNVTLSSCRLRLDSEALNGNGIQVSGGRLSVTGSRLSTGGVDEQLALITNAEGVFSGNVCDRAQDMTFSDSLVVFETGGTGVFSNNTANALGTGSSTLVQTTSDSGVNISGNQAPDWDLGMVDSNRLNLVTDNMVKSKGEMWNQSGYFAGNDLPGSAVLPPGWSISKQSTGRYDITHNQGLDSKYDMIPFFTVDGPDGSNAKWDVFETTQNSMRFTLYVGGAVSDNAFIYFEVRRRGNL